METPIIDLIFQTLAGLLAQYPDAAWIGTVLAVLMSICGICAVAVASAARQVKRGYKQRTTAQRAATVMLNAILTTALAVSCALLLPLVVPGVTPEVQIAVSMTAAGMGGETVKLWFLRRLGLSVVDLMNPDDINDIRRGMPPETRKRHAGQCPFRGDECLPADK